MRKNKVSTSGNVGGSWRLPNPVGAGRHCWLSFFGGCRCSSVGWLPFDVALWWVHFILKGCRISKRRGRSDLLQYRYAICIVATIATGLRHRTHQSNPPALLATKTAA